MIKYINMAHHKFNLLNYVVPFTNKKILRESYDLLRRMNFNAVN